MSMGPVGGVLGSAAGAPLSQTKGSAKERSAQDATNQARTVDAETKAEKAAGIGQTQEDQATGDRDADGRRMWEAIQKAKEQAEENAESPKPTKQSKDATGQAGGALDLTG